jgi:hypothetical protein
MVVAEIRCGAPFGNLDDVLHKYALARMVRGVVDVNPIEGSGEPHVAHSGLAVPSIFQQMKSLAELSLEIFQVKMQARER